MSKRMSGLSLRDFGKVADKPAEEPAIAESKPEPKPEPKPKAKAKPKPKKEERLVTVNIKILESQQEWLADTSRLVRANNDAPVPASERVYPQHLIQTAIDLLKTQDVDWDNVRNVAELRQALRL